MNVDAIVLSGGRSSRLGGVPKAALIFEARTLLERTLDAVPDARRVVIVGDESLIPDGALNRAATGAARLLVTREEPPFAGPAAAVAAGLDALLAVAPDGVPGEPGGSRAPEGSGGSAAVQPNDLVFVLACDMPYALSVTEALRAAAADVQSEEDGVTLVDDDGRIQYLAALYRMRSLIAAVTEVRLGGTLENRAARQLFEGMTLRQVAQRGGATRDVDTPEDAAAFGITIERSPSLPAGELR